MTGGKAGGSARSLTVSGGDIEKVVNNEVSVIVC